jgi:pectinesterase
MLSRLFAPRFGALLALLTVPACGSSESGGNPATGGAATSGGAATTTTGGSATTGGAATATGGSATTTSGGASSAGGGAGGNTSATGGVAGGGGAAGLDPKLCPAQTGAVTPSGSAGLQAAGKAVATSATRPQLNATQVDALYTVLTTFAHAGEIIVPVAGTGGAGGAGTGGAAGMAGSGGSGGAGGTGGSAGAAGSAGNGSAAGGASSGTITYTINDNWDPVTNGIGDVSTFVPGYTVAQDGSGTHTSIQAAITEAIYLATCPRVYIRIKAGTYRETIVIPSKTSAPPLTLYSTESDASKTVIVNNNSAAGSPTGAAVAASISGSATLTQNLPQGFQAKNLTIANDYVEDSLAGPDQSAVALLNQGDKAQYENVRVLGNRYTVYVKSLAPNAVSRSYFRDSVIEGDEDFIAGRGTAVFDHCEIHSLGSRKPTGGIIAAPSTDLTNPHGFLFVSSQFTAEPSATEAFLGHQWFEGNRQAAIGKMIVRNSTMGAHIRLADPWTSYPGRVTPKDPTATTPPILYTSDDYYPASQGPTPPETYLGEYGNSGPGASP